MDGKTSENMLLCNLVGACVPDHIWLVPVCLTIREGATAATTKYHHHQHQLQPASDNASIGQTRNATTVQATTMTFVCPHVIFHTVLVAYIKIKQHQTRIVTTMQATTNEVCKP